MLPTPIIEDREAITVTLEIEKETESAVLLFREVDRGPLLVTIPLSEVQRLYQNISQLLAQDARLFEHGPNKRDQ